MLSRRIPVVLGTVLLGSLPAAPLTRATWDEGSPTLTTGDWFDTTYDLVVTR